MDDGDGGGNVAVPVDWRRKRSSTAAVSVSLHQTRPLNKLIDKFRRKREGEGERQSVRES